MKNLKSQLAKSILLSLFIIFFNLRCYFKVINFSEEILKSETISENANYNEKITYKFSYFLNEGNLKVSVISQRGMQKEIVTHSKEKYLNSKKIRLNAYDEIERLKPCPNFLGVLCVPVVVIGIAIEFLITPFRLISFPEERIVTNVSDQGIRNYEEIKIPDNFVIKTENFQDESQKFYRKKNDSFEIPISELNLKKYKNPVVKLILHNTENSVDEYFNFIDLSQHKLNNSK